MSSLKINPYAYVKEPTQPKLMTMWEAFEFYRVRPEQRLKYLSQQWINEAKRKNLIVNKDEPSELVSDLHRQPKEN